MLRLILAFADDLRRNFPVQWPRLTHSNSSCVGTQLSGSSSHASTPSVRASFLPVLVYDIPNAGLLVFFLAWRSNRPNASISLQLAGTILSIGMLVGAALLDADTRFFGIVKVSLLYLTVVIEITSEVVAAFLKSQIPAPPSSVSMRFSTLTMIVIGEGAILPAISAASPNA